MFEGIDVAKLDASELVDLGARVKREVDALTKIDKAIKARIIDSATDGELRGESFTARVVEQVRWSLDSAKVKAEMGEDWVTAHSKPAHIKSVRYAV